MFFSKRQKGQGLVEFALILPALLMILLGIIEAAAVFQAYLAVQHAAREAARFAVTMQPSQGMVLVDSQGTQIPCDGVTRDYLFQDYPVSPPFEPCSSSESVEEWQTRRVRIIQEVAIRQAVGLAKEPARTETEISANEQNPRFFGIKVRGNRTPDAPEWWFPGLEGLPVEVFVDYNVRLLDPLYQTIIPSGQVAVRGYARMVNEGVTTGFAGEPLPTAIPTETHLPPTNTPIPTGSPAPTATSTSTPTPLGPTRTPTSTPTPTATPTVPYIVVNEYRDVHAGDALVAWLYQHPTATSYDLWWYTDVPLGSGQYITTIVATGISVDGSGASAPIEFTIPNDTEGTYYLVSFRTGTTTPEIARSALITVDPLPPDLVVQQISVTPNRVDYAGGERLVVVNLEIANLTATGVYSTYFDIDVYVNPISEPHQGLPGYHKQWRAGIGPRGTISATIPIADIVELWNGGQYQVWAQVDTSDRVSNELHEDNNVVGPVTVDAGCSVVREDDFNDGIRDSQWMFENINSSSSGTATESGGRLTINTNGTTLWGGDNSFSYLYQTVDGDFDARFQVTEAMNYTSGYAKIGLMVRQDVQPDSPYIMIIRHSYGGRTEKIQWGVRADRGADPSPSGYANGNSLPIWLRLVRQQDTFSMYFSTSTANPPADGDWTQVNSYIVGEDADFDPSMPLMIGVAAAAYHSGTFHQGSVDNFWMCLSGEGGGPPFPRYGDRTCTYPIRAGTNKPMGGGSFELGWDQYWKNGEEIGASGRDSGENHTTGGNYALVFHAETLNLGAPCDLQVPLHAWLSQSILIPEEADDPVEMPDNTTQPMIVSVEARFYHLVQPRAAPQPDPFLLTVQDVSGATPITLTNTGTFTNPGDILIVRGNATPDRWQSVSYDLVSHMTAAGNDVADYAGQNLELYWYAPNPYEPCNPDPAELAHTWFYLDDVSVEICTTVPTPTVAADMATLSGDLRVLVGQTPAQAPNTLVWIYNEGEDGELYTTYSIHDSTYHFYNIPPGTYTIYSEVWVGDLLYFTVETITLPAGVTDHDLLLQ
jgi:hypothetical protein